MFETAATFFWRSKRKYARPQGGKQQFSQQGTRTAGAESKRQSAGRKPQAG
jgi:hypothetical protein